MLLIRSAAELARARASPLDPTLLALLRTRHGQLTGNSTADLDELALFLVVDPGDSLDTIEKQLGLSLRTNAIDGTVFARDADYTPWWEFAEVHRGWFELVFVLT